MNETYTKELIENYKNPKRFGKMETPDLTGRAVNDLCGDELTLYVKNEEGKVTDIMFDGRGCAICIGSMSLIIEELMDRNIYDLLKIQEDTILDKIGMKKDSPRVRCATLSIEAIKNLK
ncbi:iron-sulfur cluster assembly scaffold protein [Candidatus Dojkabacteria bacterium]|nr:iron-sulfur cluster assembly scaffold protein [Candidatus Dojkabacteria bacterium]